MRCCLRAVWPRSRAPTRGTRPPSGTVRRTVRILPDSGAYRATKAPAQGGQPATHTSAPTGGQPGDVRELAYQSAWRAFASDTFTRNFHPRTRMVLAMNLREIGRA